MDSLSKGLLTAIAALLGIIAFEQRPRPVDVHVLNDIELRGPVPVESVGPLKVMVCDDRERCADLYPAEVGLGPGAATRWGLMTVPKAK
jgi:hypothetical protein